MFQKQDKPICPLIGKPCIKGNCAWWCTIKGYDINSGKEIDQHECVVMALPYLMIENSAQQRSTSSAVESLRNEMVTKANVTNHLLANVIVPAKIGISPSQTTTYELPESPND
jgi:hypothetical protein